MPPGVIIKAGLGIIAIPYTAPDQPHSGEGYKLQLTLCGFGAAIPTIPGEGILADAGIPRIFTQGPVEPIEIEAYSNSEISPLGTFYCIAVLTDEDDVIQANNYQFLADGTYDLSTTEPIIEGTPTMISEIPRWLTAFTHQLSAAVIGGAPIGIFYNGGFQRPGVDYQLNGLVIQTTFPVLPGELYAVYMGLANGSLVLGPVQLVVDQLTPMGAASWTLTKKPRNGLLVGLWYNDGFQRPGPAPFDYTLSGATFQTVTPNFATYDGDSVYAVYYGT
jgi:hypothetical protein